MLAHDAPISVYVSRRRRAASAVAAKRPGATGRAERSGLSLSSGCTRRRTTVVIVWQDGIVQRVASAPARADGIWDYDHASPDWRQRNVRPIRNHVGAEAASTARRALPHRKRCACRHGQRGCRDGMARHLGRRGWRSRASHIIVNGLAPSCIGPCAEHHVSMTSPTLARDSHDCCRMSTARGDRCAFDDRGRDGGVYGVIRHPATTCIIAIRGGASGVICVAWCRSDGC